MPLNQIDEKTEKSPSVSRIPVQPPYFGRTESSQSA